MHCYNIVYTQIITIVQTYQNSTEPYKDAQVIDTSHLLPYILQQPEGISWEDMVHTEGILWEVGMLLQGIVVSGKADNLPSPSGIWSNPK
jgi:hypothetical protein